MVGLKGMMRFHLDENVRKAIAVGLRQRGVDASHSADVGLNGASDTEQLNFAHTQGRVLVTHDRHLLVLDSQQQPHCGIMFCEQERFSIGEMVRKLLEFHEKFDAEEVRRRRVVFLS